MRKIYFLIAVLTIFLDQLSKWIMENLLNLYETIAVFPGFSLTLRYNSGAAFNFLADGSGWQRWLFVFFSCLVAIVLIIWLNRIPKQNKLEGVGLSLILGGAVGNLIDRLLHGYVIDFILVYYKKWEYPAFNIADTAICVGVFLFAVTIFRAPVVSKKDKT